MALVVLLVPLILFILTIIIKKRDRDAKLPPGPLKLPLIGNMHNLLGAGDPHRALYKLSHAYGPVMHLTLGQVEYVVITSPDAAKEILKNRDLNFASRPQLFAYTILFDNLGLVFSPYGNYWRHLRKNCVLELLSARRVKSFGPVRSGESSSLLTSIMSASAGKPAIVNLTQKFLLLTNTITSKAMFGAECKLAHRFITEIRKVLELCSGFNLVDLYPSLGFLSRLLGKTATIERLRDRLHHILDDIIEEHTNRKEVASTKEEDVFEDLLEALLSLKEEIGADIPLANIKATIFDLFTAGTDTSATILTWAMVELMRHPAVMEKVQQEVRHAAKGKGRVDEHDIENLHYVKLVIKETLRLHTPAAFLLRVCAEKCNIGGFKVSAGTRVMVNAWGLARDPKYWEDAESFIPERFEGSSLDFMGEDFQFLPFGGGRRVCPGIVFGLINVELTLAKLLFHFDWGLPDANELDMSESFGITLGKKVDVCLIATPRFPLPC